MVCGEYRPGPMSSKLKENTKDAKALHGNSCTLYFVFGVEPNNDDRQQNRKDGCNEGVIVYTAKCTQQQRYKWMPQNRENAKIIDPYIRNTGYLHLNRTEDRIHSLT